MAIPFAKELKAGLRAVQRAALLTKRVLNSADKGAMQKQDKTAVTVADLGAQALIIASLHRDFPEDQFLGEESATQLRESPHVAKRVWDLVSSTRLENETDAELQGHLKSADVMLDMIDKGGSGQGGRSGRVWVLDPIDGTSSFVSDEQYVVCLGLLEDGEQKVGILACQNLSLEQGKISEKSIPADGVGIVLSAILGHGAGIQKLTFGDMQPPERVTINDHIPDLSQLQLVECVASSTMDQRKHRLVAQKLSAKFPGTELWSQQMKYVALTVGGHDAMIRIPKASWHRTCVWDHAGGHLIYEEAGGKVTDMHGKAIDFGAGRRCFENIGNVAAPKSVHGRVLQAVQEVLAESSPLMSGEPRRA